MSGSDTQAKAGLKLHSASAVVPAAGRAIMEYAWLMFVSDGQQAHVGLLMKPKAQHLASVLVTLPCF